MHKVDAPAITVSLDYAPHRGSRPKYQTAQLRSSGITVSCRTEPKCKHLVTRLGMGLFLNGRGDVCSQKAETGL